MASDVELVGRRGPVAVRAQAERVEVQTPACATVKASGAEGIGIRVQITPEVRVFVRERGGRLFVWPKSYGRCNGAISLLETSTEPPRGRRLFVKLAVGFELFFDPAGWDPPEEVSLELHGRFRKRIRASWNGCVHVGTHAPPAAR